MSRPTVGDSVVVRGWGCIALVVVDDSDPSTLTLQTPNRTHLRVGEQNVVRIDECANVQPAGIDNDG